MLRYTIRISSHDLTHHSVIPYRSNHATSPDVATPQLTSLSILNYTATISPLPPRLPTSPPFRDTIPSTPSVSFFYISQVPSYLLAPWQSELMVEESMAAERSFSIIWHRRASLGKYQRHTHSSRMVYRRDAIAQYWTRRGPCSSMLGCQISFGLRPLPQQSTSKTDYRPEPSRTRLHMRDGLERSQTSHTFVLSVA